MARDGFQLVQEAVANWESLPGVRGVQVVETWFGNTTERGFMAKGDIQGQVPQYIELVLVSPDERAEGLDGYEDLDEEWLGDQAAELFETEFFGKPGRVQWRSEAWE
jgi:hypothetical protein